MAVPAALPPADALVDSAALVATVRVLGERADTGYVLLSMGYAPDGTNVRRRVIEHRVAAPVADTLQALVFAHRRTLPPAAEEWGVRLRVELGDPLRLRVGRRELCPASLRDPPLGGSLDPLGRIQDHEPPPTGTQNVAWVRVRADPLGRVTDVRLERGIFRSPRQEEALLHQVRTLSFEPAREDGVPVDAELSLPFRIPL